MNKPMTPAADDAGKDQQQRQVGSPLDQDRTQEVVEKPNADRPDQQQ